MGAGDFHVQVWQRRLACVIEPALVLGQACGPVLALGLARGFEAWLTRSFWQVLDASELLAPPRVGDARTLALDARALAGWIAMRDCTDAASWTLRWVGDNLAESRLREAAAPDLVDRYETMLAALLGRLAQAQQGAWPEHLGTHWLDRSMAAADALALSACLDGALVLCGGAGDEAPAPVSALRQAGVDTVLFDGDGGRSLLATERDLVRQALAAAGLAPLLQTLPPLAAVHVLCDEDGAAADTADAWSGARAWWYWI
jgi:hypothetical protein